MADDNVADRLMCVSRIRFMREVAYDIRSDTRDNFYNIYDSVNGIPGVYDNRRRYNFLFVEGR